MEILVYQLKVGGLIAAFYMCYRLLLSRETLHRLNRVVLLGTAALSFILPLCVVTLHRTVAVPVSVESPMIRISDGVAAASASTSLWQTVAMVVFWTGVAVTLGHTLLSLWHVVRMISTGEQHPQADGTVIVVTERAMAPSSWMRYILLSRADYERLDAAVLAHERGHVAARHSWDVLYTAVMTAMQWFNPAVWMLRADLRAIHEYEADKAVIRSGIDAREYQYLLIRKAIGAGGYSVVNGFNHSTLKNRITMMLQSKSPRAHSWKALFVIPVAALAVAVNAKTVTDYQYTPERQTDKPVAASRKKVGVKAMAPVGEQGKTAVDLAKNDKLNTAVYFLNGVRQKNDEQVKALKPDDIKSMDVFKNVGDHKTTVSVITNDFDESKAPKVKVRGKVVDGDGKIVVGAIVKQSGTQVGTVTGLDGRFVMEDLPLSASLEVMYVGFETARFAALQGLDDVTVTVKKVMDKPAVAAPDDKATYEVDGVQKSREQVDAQLKPDKIEAIQIEKKADGNKVVKIKTKK